MFGSTSSRRRIVPVRRRQRIATTTLIASSMRSRASRIAVGTSSSGKVCVYQLSVERFCAISAVA
jgi:hypothetical protein